MSKKRQKAKRIQRTKSKKRAKRAAGGWAKRPVFLLFSGILVVIIAYVVYLKIGSSRTPLAESEAAKRSRMLPFPAIKAATQLAKPVFEDFVGSQACAGCHTTEYRLWQQSTHGQAGGKPGEVEIIAAFDGKPLRFKDAVVTPFVNSQGEYVFVVVQEGQPKTEIKVEATVGGGHMYGGGTQTFFMKSPDGTVLFCPSILFAMKICGLCNCEKMKPGFRSAKRFH